MPGLGTAVEALAVATRPGARGVTSALTAGTVTAAAIVARSARSPAPAHGVAVEATPTRVATPCRTVRTVTPRTRPGVTVARTRAVVTACAVLPPRTTRRVATLAPGTLTLGAVAAPGVTGAARPVATGAVRASAGTAARPVPRGPVTARAATVLVAPTTVSALAPAPLVPGASARSPGGPAAAVARRRAALPATSLTGRILPAVTVAATAAVVARGRTIRLGLTGGVVHRGSLSF